MSKCKYDSLYIDICKKYATMSSAKKKKVGAVIVKENNIIADGYNGTPSGFNNDCEDENGNTHWYVFGETMPFSNKHQLLSGTKCQWPISMVQFRTNHRRKKMPTALSRASRG